jgi:aspartate 1-decarboxylase
MVSLNGAAARKAQPGDLVIIAAFAHMTPEEAKNFQPDIVFPDANNHIV